MEEFINEQKIINQIRSLGIDMIHEAESGHPGITLGAAPIIYNLYAHHLNVNPKNSSYFNRDRLILSAGHGSALLYATLHLAGYDLSIEDLQNFRKLNSKTPGHPELGKTPGVDFTTGPLGQGIASAVGIAIGETVLSNKFNDAKNKVIDYYTYVLCGDGDLMEGISYEATSLAGTLELNKLIVIYDSNNATIDSKTNITFTENITDRFKAINWNVITVNDGEDIVGINSAILDAKKSNKPTLIEVKTTIGKYSNFENNNVAHGMKLTAEDISSIKNKMDQRDIPFAISKEAIEDFQLLINNRCSKLEVNFNERVKLLDEENQTLINNFINNNHKVDFNNFFYEAPENGMESPRATSHRILSFLVKNNFQFIGGSADAFLPTKTYIPEVGDYSKDNRGGKNIFFGIREHAMGAIMNGLATLGFRSYGSTFTTFSDYMKPAIRLSSLMNLDNIYILTHDSIGVGKDGATHQPVEQLPSFRMMPNLEVFRPADANEVIGVYKAVIENKNPSVIMLATNNFEVLSSTNVTNVSKGGYTVYEPKRPLAGVIISSGEEVHLAIKVAEKLATKGIDVRVVSMPSLNRFLKQSAEYQDEILPVEVRRIIVETTPSMSWNQISYNNKYIISLEEYGLSGSKEEIHKHFGFDVDSLEEKIENLLK